MQGPYPKGSSWYIRWKDESGNKRHQTFHDYASALKAAKAKSLITQKRLRNKYPPRRCKWCNKKFQQTRQGLTKLYCTTTCKQNDQYAAKRPPRFEIKKCKHCNSDFENILGFGCVKRPKEMFCSKKCCESFSNQARAKIKKEIRESRTKIFFCPCGVVAPVLAKGTRKFCPECQSHIHAARGAAFARYGSPKKRSAELQEAIDAFILGRRLARRAAERLAARIIDNAQPDV